MQTDQQQPLKDSIPAAVKQHFFKNRDQPNLYSDYDVIGFDADHCIVKYNIRALTELLIKSELEDFVEMGYPKELLDFPLNDEGYSMCMNGSIFDIENGLVIKLAEGQEVVRAMKGFKPLSKFEIEAVYGFPPIFRHYQWPNTTHLTSQKGAYWVFMTFFDTCKAALVLSAVELLEKGILKNRTYFDIAMDIRAIVYKNYVHYSDKEVKKIDTYGSYFPPVCKDPTKYIQQQPELRETLTKLRKAGKKLFLATNSHTEYSNLIMTTTLGDDWRSFFDITCCNCRKPLFFWDQKPDPFFVIDDNKPNMKGREIFDGRDLVEGQTYLQGNSKTLTQFFKHTTGKDIVRIAFFGDQYITDVYSSSINPEWDGIAVVEELSFYDDRYAEGVDPQLIKYNPKCWGEDHFIEAQEDGKSVKRSYFIAQLEECARYIIPFVKNIKLWMPDQQ